MPSDAALDGFVLRWIPPTGAQVDGVYPTKAEALGRVRHLTVSEPAGSAELWEYSFGRAVRRVQIVIEDPES